MSKVLGIIAAVLLAVTAFVAYKNKAAYQAEIDANAKSEKLAASTTEKLIAEQQRVIDAGEEEAQKKELAETMQTELEEFDAQVVVARAKVEELKAEHGKSEAQGAAAEEALKDLPDPDELIPELKQNRDALTAATSEIAEKGAILANLVQRSKTAEANVGAKREAINLYNTGKSFATLNTSIRTVYRQWGFVILSAGDAEGVVSGSILDVVRGGEIVAKLKVTAVEAGRSSADIVLGSVAEGVSLHAGDTVVSEKVAATPATAAVSP